MIKALRTKLLLWLARDIFRDGMMLGITKLRFVAERADWDTCPHSTRLRHGRTDPDGRTVSCWFCPDCGKSEYDFRWQPPHTLHCGPGLLEKGRGR